MILDHDGISHSKEYQGHYFITQADINLMGIVCHLAPFMTFLPLMGEKDKSKLLIRRFY